MKRNDRESAIGKQCACSEKCRLGKRSETIFGVECLEEPQKCVPEFSLFFDYSLSGSFLLFPTFTYRFHDV
jgi:hypothetical protein